MLADFHVHTGYSDDSVYPMRRVVEDAIRLNLDELCFTEHVDYGVKPEWDQAATADVRDGRAATNPAYPAYFAEVSQLKAEFADKINLRCGLELGIQVHTVKQFEALLGRYEREMDFALLSCHQVGDLEFWTGEYQAGKTQAEYNRGYYEELLHVVQTYAGPWSVLAHLDLIRRYDPVGVWPTKCDREVIAELLRQTIESGHGIEVNTSYVRYGLQDMTPAADILQLYKDLGGTILTFGSDSHKPKHLGAYLRDAQRKAAALGFEYGCTFEKWEPKFYRLMTS